MTPADLSLTVLRAVRRAVDDGALRVDVPPRVKIERARPGGAGEYASSIALALARPAGRSALDVAGILEERLRGVPGLRAVEITGPGFLNFTLRSDTDADLVREILAAGTSYGHGTALAGTVVRLAGATEARAALVAETLVRLLRSQGAGVEAGSGDGERVHVHPGAPGGHGTDAVRWAFLRAAPHDRPLDPGPLLVPHERNPLFRVQYAHSRTRRLLVNARQLGFTPEPGRPGHPRHHAAPLLGALRDHPLALLSAARHRAPDRVARHLEAVADALLAFQHTVLPLGDEKPSAAHRSRLALAEAAGTVLAGGLSVLGISAPDRI
ncbi:ArgS-related anticodon-binding protein NrtL [Streptomyces bikiniensis]|uniref:ArgS-related anticodon-binding protein NrtL n=1 Tax=Streptomyces bikiniensis TaxID=1896 RepID=UPI0004C0BBB2|nr:DALR anticodon-binding domain-containing protein [Streptomyces bikiniensis]